MIEKVTRKLFQLWLQTPAWKQQTKKGAACYGTYLENCESLEITIFGADGKLRPDLLQYKGALAYARVTPANLQVKTTTKISHVKAAIAAFESFIDWILELPLAADPDDILAVLSNAYAVGDPKPKKQQGKSVVGKKIKKTDTPGPDVWDSYERLFNFFKDRKFDSKSFYRFGIDNSVYGDRISSKTVEDQLDLLINLLETGKFGNVDHGGRTSRREYLSIRKYSGSEVKSELFREVYGRVFPHANIKVEKSGNTAPKSNITKAAHCQLYSQSEKYNIASDTTLLLLNYQCSHVFDDRTKNPLLFESVWNVVLTPKVTDPLTGHETLGMWPRQFQPTFRNSIRQKFMPCICKYNAIADKYREQIRNAAEAVVNEHEELKADEKQAFIVDMMHQWDPIETDLESESF